MTENNDDKVKTNLVDLENKLNEAFEYAFAVKELGIDYDRRTGSLDSIGTIAQALLETRRQRHIEEGRGEMYHTRHNVNMPQQRTLDKRGRS